MVTRIGILICFGNILIGGLEELFVIGRCICRKGSVCMYDYLFFDNIFLIIRRNIISVSL